MNKECSGISRERYELDLNTVCKELRIFFDEKMKNCPELRILNENFPELSYECVIELMAESYLKQNKRLLFHVQSLIEITEKLHLEQYLSEHELQQLYLGILYHDSAKILSTCQFDNQARAELISYLLDDQYGHSLAIQRLFLYLGLPELSRVMRHNDQDFLTDRIQHRLFLVQLMLNLVDRLDNSGNQVNLQEKMSQVKNRIGKIEGFDEQAMELAYQELSKIFSFLSQGKIDFIRNYLEEFGRQANQPLEISVVGRMDGKYHPPTGNYADTSSALHIAEAMSKMGWKTTIWHGGNFPRECHRNGMIEIIPANQDSIKNGELYSNNPDIILVEGLTSIMPFFREERGKKHKAFLALIFRAFSGGKLSEQRLHNAAQADEIWGVSNAVTKILNQQFESMAQNPPTTRVITNGVDHEIFKPNESLPRTKGKIVYVGALKSEKGLNLLIDAFKIVRQIIPFAELHLIGSGEMYGSTTEQTNEDGIILHGQLSHSIVADHLRTAMVTVLLSDPKLFETFGKAIEEAKACGSPVIVSNSGGLPERITSPEVGTIITELTPEEVARVLIQWLEKDPKDITYQPNLICDWRIAAIDIITAYFQHSRINNYN